MESISIPEIPPTIAATANRDGHANAAASAAIDNAPVMPPRSPAIVTPPDVPTGTRFPDIIDLGAWLDSVPISVAHVSAIAVPMAPAPAAHQIVDGQTMLKIPKTAKAPPFAKTCNASRSPPFSTISPVSERFFDSPILDRRVELKKNAMSIHAQLQPAAVHAVATKTAAIAPLSDRVRLDFAMRTIAQARAKPPIRREIAKEDSMPVRRSPAGRLQ